MPTLKLYSHLASLQNFMHMLHIDSLEVTEPLD